MPLSVNFRTHGIAIRVSILRGREGSVVELGACCRLREWSAGLVVVVASTPCCFGCLETVGLVSWGWEVMAIQNIEVEECVPNG
eukprot:2387344-Pyramimonas_sp.AAC.1